MKLFTNSAEETIELGKKIGNALKGGEVILLYGNLGCGKTIFTKGLAEGIGIKEEVVSPTYTIERIYSGRLCLHHFDFYRLHHGDQELSEELDEITQDYKNVTVIEWPENIRFQPTDSLAINFSYLDDEKRQLEFEVNGNKAKKILEHL